MASYVAFLNRAVLISLSAEEEKLLSLTSLRNTDWLLGFTSEWAESSEPVKLSPLEKHFLPSRCHSVWALTLTLSMQSSIVLQPSHLSVTFLEKLNQ